MDEYSMENLNVKDQLNEIMKILHRIEAVIDTRFLGVETPDKEDLDVIQDFEKREREGTLELRKV